MVMALHRRIGKDSIANMLDLHILRDICSFLPMRRTGTALADGEEIGKRSPSVTTMIKELRLAPKPLPSPPSSPPPTSPRSDAGGSAADDGSPAAEEEGVE